MEKGDTTKPRFECHHIFIATPLACCFESLRIKRHYDAYYCHRVDVIHFNHLMLILSNVNIRGGVEDTGLEAKDTKNFEAKDRPSRGQGHRRKCSPKKKKRRSSKIFFRRKRSSIQKIFSGNFYLRKPKKGLCRFSARFLAFSDEISTVQKIVLSSSRGQAKFQGLEASRPRTSKCVLEAKYALVDSTSGNYLDECPKFFEKKIKLSYCKTSRLLLHRNKYSVN